MRHVLYFALGAMFVGSAAARAEVTVTTRNDSVHVQGEIERVSPGTNNIGSFNGLFGGTETFSNLFPNVNTISTSGAGSINDTATGTQLVGSGSASARVTSTLAVDEQGSLISYGVFGTFTSSATTQTLESYHPEDTSHDEIELDSNVIQGSSIEILVSSPIEYSINVSESVGRNDLAAEIIQSDNNQIINPPIQLFGVVGGDTATRTGTLLPSALPYNIIFAEIDNNLIDQVDNFTAQDSADFAGLFSVVPDANFVNVLFAAGVFLTRRKA